jgi:hypothetical protein
MSAHANPDIVTNGLVFGFDTGYPLVSESHETYRYNRGEPTTTFDVGTMVPTNPNTYFTSNATYHSNLHGTVWDWSYYPNSNISADGGMEWVPNYEGRGFIGAWKMKKRAGGNSESNFAGAAPASIDSSKTYTVSVWCKTDQASMARIHINTTKDGSSYWGYGSSTHSGGGDWERLTLTIPAGAGNTSINTIRCQCNGTTINADAYWRDYQVEERSHATPFILGGTRSATGSLIDLTGTTNIDVSNASFDSNAQMTFDGTDDYADVSVTDLFQPQNTTDGFTVEYVYRPEANTSVVPIGNLDSTNGWFQAPISNGSLGAYLYFSTHGVVLSTDSSYAINSGIIGKYQHIVMVLKWSDTANSFIMVNGEDKTASKATASKYTVSGSANPALRIGKRGGSIWPANGQIPLVKIYNRALTAAEVLQNYNATKSRFNL